METLQNGEHSIVPPALLKAHASRSTSTRRSAGLADVSFNLTMDLNSINENHSFSREASTQAFQPQLSINKLNRHLSRAADCSALYNRRWSSFCSQAGFSFPLFRVSNFIEHKAQQSTSTSSPLLSVHGKSSFFLCLLWDGSGTVGHTHTL